MQKLSIVIPTYNRREKLLRQLHAIFGQPESKDIDVTVLDNHSDYDCDESVYADFPKESYPNLRVITHPYNIGGNMNISLCFYYGFSFLQMHKLYQIPALCAIGKMDFL